MHNLPVKRKESIII